MAIKSINMDRALSSEIYAAQAIRSGKLTASQRGQLVVKWGADKVNKWQSVDTNEYIIDDDTKSAAKEKGKQEAKDATGYSGNKNCRSIGSAIGGAATAATAVATAVGAKFVGKALVNKVGAKTFAKVATGQVTKKAVSKSMEKMGTKAAKDKAAKNLSDLVAVALAAAEVAQYLIKKPNEEQYKAIMELFSTTGEGLLPEQQENLTYAQEDMQLATEESTDIAEETEEINDEANEDIEENKTMMDFYKAQYEALIMKAHNAANGGEPLTADEKALLTKLAPILQEIIDGINTTNEETSEVVNENYENMEEYQSVYDEGAETIATAEGVTDYAENFDETTRTMCYVEGAGQTLNAAGAALASGRLFAKGPWFWAPAAIGAAAAVSSGIFAGKQFGMASEIGIEIDYREQTQQLETESYDVYNEELENHVGNLEVVDDLEIEIPEDMEIPEAPVTIGDDTSNASMMTLASGNEDDKTNGNNGVSNNPFAVTPTGNDSDDDMGVKGADDETETETSIPLENDPEYVNAMGNGSNWHEVMSGNISRSSDDDIVTDSNGKVVLTAQYADAITSVTGAKEGEFFSKDFIPKILEKVLGSPFNEKMIKKVHNGGTLDSEYTAKILGTKDQDDRGTGSVDNSAKATAMAKKVIDFYWPIFEKASTKGWVRG